MKLAQQPRGRLLKNESLSEYVSWRTGGCADFLFLPKDTDDLADLFKQLSPEMPVTWLGLGSNTLIRDGGLEGLVIITQGTLMGLAQIDELKISAGAGVACAQLARFTARLGLTGLEFMAGIPGTVGGALAMNAGCFGGETWQYVYQAETISRTGQKQIRAAEDFKVGYRHVQRPDNEWFTTGYFALQPGERETSLEAIRTLLDKRSASQPTGTANCGSVFRNPPGDYAGRLIQECGLKGKRIGQAYVSEKHANFIINDGGARASDIEQLIMEVRSLVAEKTKVLLVPEVCIIGRSAKE